MHLKSLILLLFTPMLSVAQSDWYARQWDQSQLQLEIKRALNPTRVLYVAAHPDDENTRLISWLANELHADVAYLSLTNGSGGQNLVGEEIGTELGLIREQELLAARRMDGGKQYFTSALDFGYSKTHEETLEKWDEEKVLGEVVYRIRAFQPHIIITRFSPTTDGLRSTHGHHTASAMLALEAFRMAADSTAYPNQLTELEPWETEAIYWNTSWWSYGSKEIMDSVYEANPHYYVKIDAEGYVKERGMSISEIASESRSMHKSQGFGTRAYYGASDEYLKLLSGKVNAKERLSPHFSLLSSYINAPLNNALQAGHIGPEAIRAGIEEGIRSGRMNAEQIHRLQQVYFQCMGLRAFLMAPSYYADAGTREWMLQLIHYGEQPIHLELDSTQLLAPGQLYEFPVQQQVSAGQRPSFTLQIDGYPLTVPVVYRTSDPVIGEIVQPVQVLEGGAVNILNPEILLINGQEVPVQVEVTPLMDAEHISFHFGSTEAGAFSGTYNAGQTYRFEISAPRSSAVLTTRIGDRSTQLSCKRITYDHLPWIYQLQEARVEVHRIDAKCKAKKVGYVMGAGDMVPEAIRALGAEVDLIDPFQTNAQALKSYDAVVFGIRALNTLEGIDAVMDQFYTYCEKGGTLVMQYNTSHRLQTDRIGPEGQHISLSRQRVTQEDAPVQMGKHAVLQQPNMLTTADFDGWVQERGLYFPSVWPEGYEAPLQMHDSGEEALEGSLLILDCGKGTFVYTGLSFFRELPAGVEGAYRLWANILSL